MPGKYQIEASYTISASIEPDGYIGGVENDVLDYEDNSSFSYETVAFDGGEIRFLVEADSENEARDQAQHVIDGAHFVSNDIEWELDSIEISGIECIEEPMDMERALTIIRAFLTRITEMGGVTSDEQDAFSFLLDHITP